MKYTIPQNEIKYRVGSSRVNPDGKTGYAICLIYIDARTAYDALDEMYGNLNWKFSWDPIEGNMWAVAGKLEIYNKDIKEWVAFNDVGYTNESKRESWNYINKQYDQLDPGQTEWLKDAVSDAVKRCAVQVGVGRELYNAPFLYTEEVKIKNNKVSGLTDTGKQIIEGKINEWFKKQ